MAKDDPLDATEEVVRAGMYPYWDADLNRATPSAFTSTEVSVSRLAILDFDQIVSIFRVDFSGRTHPDGESMQIRGTGRAAVAIIIQQAERPMDGNGLPNSVLTVTEDEIKDDPLASDNPSHALIRGWDRERPNEPRKISRGVAKRLLDVFRWEPLSD